MSDKRMKKPIKIVKQLRAGCAPACLAMVLDKPYEEVLADFNNDFLDEGIELEKTSDYLSDFGFKVIKKEVEWYNDDVKFGRDELLKPFATVHLVRLKPKFDSQSGHLVVMDSEGVLHCPSGASDEETRKAYQIIAVLGLYK